MVRVLVPGSSSVILYFAGTFFFSDLISPFLAQVKILGVFPFPMMMDTGQMNVELQMNAELQIM